MFMHLRLFCAQLSRTVTGVFSTIKDALPNFDDDHNEANGEDAVFDPTLNMPAILVPNRYGLSL